MMIEIEKLQDWEPNMKRRGHDYIFRDARCASSISYPWSLKPKSNSSMLGGRSGTHAVVNRSPRSTLNLVSPRGNNGTQGSPRQVHCAISKSVSVLGKFPMRESSNGVGSWSRSSRSVRGSNAKESAVSDPSLVKCSNEVRLGGKLSTDSSEMRELHSSSMPMFRMVSDRGR